MTLADSEWPARARAQTAGLVLVLAACGSRPATPTSIAQHTVVVAPKPHVLRGPFVVRNLSVGTDRATTSRATSVLSIDGDTATLVATDEEAQGFLTLVRADREAKWKVTGTTIQKGLVTHVGDHLAIELSSASSSLALRCWQHPLAVAVAGAIRVPTKGIHVDCDDPGAWSPAEITYLEAWVCGFGDGLDNGQITGMDGQLGSLDETLYRFAELPGVEVVEENDACFQSKGLRLVR